MDTLIASLKVLEASELPEGDDAVVLQHEDHGLISVIEALANSLLITPDGTPDFAEIDRLYHEEGYFILPGEGGRTARLRTTKGLIVFG